MGDIFGFNLKPDIIVNNENIIDTKWKLVSKKENISQSDIYQMFAYMVKKNIKKGILLYPYNNQNLELIFLLRFVII
ncbi:5-methylcytosine restriction system specificity protein McrC [Caminibacter sp.]